ncbi:hypothetical protein AB0H23_27430 [Streptomyces albogriseolus]|uniref:hypothetical protein n=1 Tax=Streptomyces albogriseolus TaxID=1887 RepID=UPI00345FB881
MSQLTYPRTAATIAARARMALAAYRAVPGHEATHHLERSLHDMWQYGYFAHRNDDTPTSPWPQTSQQLFDALQQLKPVTAQPSRPAQAAHAAADAIHRFEQATGITPRTAPEPLYTRTEAEQAAHAAFEHLSLPTKPDHDRQFVTEAFLAFLDNPDSPHPSKSHAPNAPGSDADEPEPELTPAETGERENSLLHWLGPRTDTPPSST